MIYLLWQWLTYTPLQRRNTPLMVACRRNNKAMVELLLKHGAGIHLANEVSCKYLPCLQLPG